MIYCAQDFSLHDFASLFQIERSLKKLHGGGDDDGRQRERRRRASHLKNVVETRQEMLLLVENEQRER